MNLWSRIILLKDNIYQNVYLFRARGTYPVRRGTGMRGRPPGSRRHWSNDDDDDDYDQYEDTNARYGPRKQMNYRASSKCSV